MMCSHKTCKHSNAYNLYNLIYNLGSALAALSVEARSYFLNKQIYRNYFLNKFKIDNCFK